MLLGGDWRQLLPVVRNCYSSSILDYTLKRDEELWPHFQVRTNKTLFFIK